ncbi:hypothetical protein EIP91_011861 [Steccherinum ochraceum]|uniref:F-box domain-containing protein n=1 Tax=Steccherinum ochraceum TaxID=92696 RepID=A0A4R0RXU2_9APHY|nr:hypothetical protein EIP91_011861 [Steccherinum ochraceum]
MHKGLQNPRGRPTHNEAVLPSQERQADPDVSPPASRSEVDAEDCSESQLLQELVDEIIDLCAGDQPTLLACCRTARSWVERSQMHIHRSIRLRLAYLLNNPARYSSSQVAKYVRRLNLGALPSGPKRGVQDNPSALNRRKGAWTVLRRLTHLQELVISTLDIQYSHFPFVISNIRTTFTNITLLNIPNAQFRTFAHFGTFITAFPNISRLELKKLGWYPGDQTLPVDCKQAAESFAARLQQLAILSYGSGDMSTPVCEEFVRLIRQPGVLSVLHTLRLCNWDMVLSTIAISSLFEFCGPSLTHLELPIIAPGYFFPHRLDEVAEMGFYNLVRLHELTFTTRAYYSDIIPSCLRFDHGKLLPAILSRLGSAHLRRIALSCLHVPPDEIHNAIKFDAVDEVLSQPQFGSLQRLEIVFERGDERTNSALEESVKALMPQAMARGIVYIEFGKEH